MTIAYDTHGHGREKVLALHGWMGDENTYAPLLPALDASLFTFAFPAYRGYGASRHLSGEFTIAEIARDVVGVADDLGWDRFHLVGHSMGGMVIQQVLLDAPARVRKMIAVTPVPACGARFDADTLQLFSSAATSHESCAAIIDFATGGRLPRQWIRRMARLAQSSATPEAMSAYLDAFDRTDISGAVQANPAEIQVLVGQFDPAHTVQAMQATYGAWYPNARIEMLANAGHYPMDEIPLALAAAIESFLKP